MKKILILIILTWGLGNSLMSQNSAVAKLFYNHSKSASNQAGIEYNTSFMVGGYTGTSEQLILAKEKIKNMIAISKIEFSILDNKDLMVILDLSVANTKELTKRMKVILNELQIEKVEYNGVLYTTKEFEF